MAREPLPMCKIEQKNRTPLKFLRVRYGGGEAVFTVEGTVELRESHGLKVKELARAQGLAEEHQQLIMEKWHEHLD